VSTAGDSAAGRLSGATPLQAFSAAAPNRALTVILRFGKSKPHRLPVGF